MKEKLDLLTVVRGLDFLFHSCRKHGINNEREEVKNYFISKYKSDIVSDEDSKKWHDFLEKVNLLEKDNETED